MIKSSSIGVILDNFIDLDNVDELLEKIKVYSSKSSSQFKLILYNIDVDEAKVREFVKRHENLLFKVNAKFTKILKEYVFFLIDDSFNQSQKQLSISLIEKINFRYRYLGSLEKGLEEFVRILVHIKNRDNIR
tara:strand:+ start:7711 stop:8109 length:399 start_codon:yes stop_codon:yes gene_type:complete